MLLMSSNEGTFKLRYASVIVLKKLLLDYQNYVHGGFIDLNTVGYIS